jgi:hypothetical protein
MVEETEGILISGVTSIGGIILLNRIDLFQSNGSNNLIYM